MLLQRSSKNSLLMYSCSGGFVTLGMAGTWGGFATQIAFSIIMLYRLSIDRAVFLRTICS